MLLAGAHTHCSALAAGGSALPPCLPRGSDRSLLQAAHQGVRPPPPPAPCSCCSCRQRRSPWRGSASEHPPSTSAPNPARHTPSSAPGCAGHHAELGAGTRRRFAGFSLPPREAWPLTLLCQTESFCDPLSAQAFAKGSPSWGTRWSQQLRDATCYWLVTFARVFRSTTGL